MIISDEAVPQKIKRRREVVFLILSGVFLGTLVMLNILGVSRFIDLSETIGIPEGNSITFSLAIGVLPYPITFLCTDFISELYGKRRANYVVWVGLILNIWVLFVIWLGGWLNAPSNLQADGKLPIMVENGVAIVPHDQAFYAIRSLAFGATFASMAAYLTAQFVDVQIFHYLKRKTKGKKLWLRNNVSTLMSQLIDSCAVILITHYFVNGIPINDEKSLSIQLTSFILSAYLFKAIIALLDTIPFYFGTRFLKQYLKIKTNDTISE